MLINASKMCTRLIDGSQNDLIKFFDKRQQNVQYTKLIDDKQNNSPNQVLIYIIHNTTFTHLLEWHME